MQFSIRRAAVMKACTDQAEYRRDGKRTSLMLVVLVGVLVELVTFLTWPQQRAKATQTIC